MKIPIIMPMVSNFQNQELIRSVSIDEIKEAIQGVEPDKAPGSDGYPTFFFHKF